MFGVCLWLWVSWDLGEEEATDDPSLACPGGSFASESQLAISA